MIFFHPPCILERNIGDRVDRSLGLSWSYAGCALHLDIYVELVCVGSICAKTNRWIACGSLVGKTKVMRWSLVDFALSWKWKMRYPQHGVMVLDEIERMEAGAACLCSAIRQTVCASMQMCEARNKYGGQVRVRDKDRESGYHNIRDPQSSRWFLGVISYCLAQQSADGFLSI